MSLLLLNYVPTFFSMVVGFDVITLKIFKIFDSRTNFLGDRLLSSNPIPNRDKSQRLEYSYKRGIGLHLI